MIGRFYGSFLCPNCVRILSERSERSEISEGSRPVSTRMIDSAGQAEWNPLTSTSPFSRCTRPEAVSAQADFRGHLQFLPVELYPPRPFRQIAKQPQSGSRSWLPLGKRNVQRICMAKWQHYFSSCWHLRLQPAAASGLAYPVSAIKRSLRQTLATAVTRSLIPYGKISCPRCSSDPQL